MSAPRHPVFEMTGDQYELFPLLAGPTLAFRQLPGMARDAAPAVAAQPADGPQYEFFPELAVALQPKAASPAPAVDKAEMVDGSLLERLRETLGPANSAAPAPALVNNSAPVYRPVPLDEPAPRRFGERGE